MPSDWNKRVTDLLTGVIPPLVTPFDANGDVHTDDLRSLCGSLADGGVHGLFALGSSGEVGFLSDAMRDTALATIVEASQGLPVLAGCIDTSATRVLDHARRAADIGAGYAIVTAPFYAKTCTADIEAHFRWIAERSPLPVVAYDIPVAVHSKLDSDMLVRLALDGVIAAVKDSSGDQGAMRRLIRLNKAAGSPLRVFTGTEVVVDANLLMGVDGVVPGLGNVAPAGYVQLYDAARRGDWATAVTWQDRLEEFFDIVYADPDLVGPAQAIGGFKAAMTRRGVLSSWRTCAPQRPLSTEAVAKINELTDSYVTWEAGQLGRPATAHIETKEF
ncbi:dihydrodipicolinate synthase family protein [Tessaracoccus defluvii]|uniref:Dihydrodipicolinate synthase family protein n=1 Tax=Tessaracoccus defluvii TaxID=1285901 RepID=A0A7H0H3Z5_9ACTN|nr:dihydrodipicolinate synthase family protein [Tessaracoccus defluvii]